eukprot:CAMPEP_0184979120 /NCGR_PEP_ID=MMETSP1098-20130426/9482_1 /TAXON_ID=89044 /ORGANISM="Spumella elongata, Strain CCAP 955/1" /LENGTH=135 /DNA_ID=CAMNT_0027502389 /DNA_START=37 /DNA_END=444 /DNA_ORIENTATION=-
MSRRPAPTLSADEAANKQIKIQLGICKRMIKEVASYEKEVTTNEAKIQKMKDDGKDSYDIRKQEEVLQESYMMIPDSKSRLEKVILELVGILNELPEDVQVDSSLLGEARELVAQHDVGQGAEASATGDDDDEPL